MQFRTHFSALSREKRTAATIHEHIGVMDVVFKLTWELRRFVIRAACVAGGSRLLGHGAQRREPEHCCVPAAPSAGLDSALETVNSGTRSISRSIDIYGAKIFTIVRSMLLPIVRFCQVCRGQ